MAKKNTTTKQASKAATKRPPQKSLSPTPNAQPPQSRWLLRSRRPSLPRSRKRKAAAPKKTASTALEIHINKTGRACFGKTAAARLEGMNYIAVSTEGNACPSMRPPNRRKARPHLLCRWPPICFRDQGPEGLLFDGSTPYDIETKPYGDHGFEFDL